MLPYPSLLYRTVYKFRVETITLEYDLFLQDNVFSSSSCMGGK